MLSLRGWSWSLTGSFTEWTLLPDPKRRIWWLETTVDSPAEALYKFSDGQAYIPDPFARRYGYDENGEFSLVESSKAHLERWYSEGTDQLMARRLRIWVPEGGQFERTLYVHDAQNIFDPRAPWGGWRLPDSLPEKTLVVGIDNTIQRMEEYTHTTDSIDGSVYGGLGDAYADYLHLEFDPSLRTLRTAPSNGLMGASLGGLISLYTDTLPQ